MAAHVERARHEVSGELRLGISLCGNVDPESGDAILVPDLGWRNPPFGKLVSRRFQLPVRVATDARQAALAEAIWVPGVNERNFAWATVSAGYGGYLFLNGRLYGGAHGFAGNFGHNTYDAGRSRLLSPLAQDGIISVRAVFEAIELGDAAAAAIVDQAIRLICINLGAVVNLLDIKLIARGGGVTKAAPWLVERINQAIRAYLMTDEAQRALRVWRESTVYAALWAATRRNYTICCGGTRWCAAWRRNGTA